MSDKMSLGQYLTYACIALIVHYGSAFLDDKLEADKKTKIKDKTEQLEEWQFKQLPHHQGYFVKMHNPYKLELRVNYEAEELETYRIYDFKDSVVVEHDVDIQSNLFGKTEKDFKDMQWKLAEFENNKVGSEFGNSEMRSLTEMLLYIETSEYYKTHRTQVKSSISLNSNKMH